MNKDKKKMFDKIMELREQIDYMSYQQVQKQRELRDLEKKYLIKL